MSTTRSKDGTRLMIPLSAAISVVATAFGIWFALLNSMEQGMDLHVKYGHPEAVRPEEISALKLEINQANEKIQYLRDEITALKSTRNGAGR